MREIFNNSFGFGYAYALCACGETVEDVQLSPEDAAYAFVDFLFDCGSERKAELMRRICLEFNRDFCDKYIDGGRLEEEIKESAEKIRGKITDAVQKHGGTVSADTKVYISDEFEVRFYKTGEFSFDDGICCRINDIEEAADAVFTVTAGRAEAFVLVNTCKINGKWYVRSCKVKNV